MIETSSFLVARDDLQRHRFEPAAIAPDALGG
jgi:hypothetical protein